MFLPVRFITLLNRQHDKGADAGEAPLVTNEEAKALANVAARQIENRANAGILQQHKELFYLLFRWKEMASEEIVRNFVDQLLSTRVGLLTFLRASVTKVLSSSGNFNRIDKQSVGALCPIDKVTMLVDGITAEEFQALEAASQEAINLFRNPRDVSWRPGDL